MLVGWVGGWGVGGHLSRFEAGNQALWRGKAVPQLSDTLSSVSSDSNCHITGSCLNKHIQEAATDGQHCLIKKRHSGLQI